MGLDMYLTQKVYIGSTWSEEGRPGIFEIEQNLCNNILKIPMYKIKTIELEFLYWRKANAIHNWFVKNIQDGVDDCGEYYIKQEKLQDLYSDLTKAILSQDPTVIKPTGGFFFGSAEINDFYWAELNRTAAQIKPIIDEWKKPYDEQDPLISNSDFYYSSSW
jgi:hypothetical protein